MCAQIFTLVLLSALTSLLTGCGSGSFPEEMPPDLSITYHDDGGMLPHSRNIRISADETLFTTYDNGNKNEYRVKTDLVLFGQLYQDLRAAKVWKISANIEEEVYDRGGFSFSVSFGDNDWDFNDSGRSFIEKGSQEYFIHGLKAIGRYMDAVLNPLKVIVTARIVGNPPEGMSYFQLSLGEVDLYRWNEKNEEPFDPGPHQIEMLPGTQSFFGTILKGGAHTSDTRTEVIPDSGLNFMVNLESGKPRIIFQGEDEE